MIEHTTHSALCECNNKIKPLTKKDILGPEKDSDGWTPLITMMHDEKCGDYFNKSDVLGAKAWLKQTKIHSIPKSEIEDCGDYIKVKGDYIPMHVVDEAFDIEEDGR